VDTSGKPVVLAPVNIEAHGVGLDSIHRTVLTDTTGRYHLTRIWPDKTATVALAKDGYSQRSLAINGIEAGREYASPLVLHPATLSAEGICVNAAGNPMPHIGVTGFFGLGTYCHSTPTIAADSASTTLIRGRSRSARA